MDWGVAWRAALSQAFVVAVLGAATGLTLSHEIFASWGFAIGPGAWIVATAVTVLVWKLPGIPTFVGAVAAGLVSLIGVATGLHWTGSVIALVLFALWCGWQGRRPGLRLSAR
ncbi:MAG: hypothetical protein EXQ74_07455 [Thermoleophilia bacterium]|nr:hypothetical protein [Thermoleophilia bacterium]